VRVRQLQRPDVPIRISRLIGVSPGEALAAMEQAAVEAPARE
jgi:hypothetical protein